MLEWIDIGGTRRVGGLLGVAGRLSGTVSPFRAEQGTSLETPSWQPTPVFLPGESHGRRSLVGYGPRGRKESDSPNRIPPGGAGVSRNWVSVFLYKEKC